MITKGRFVGYFQTDGTEFTRTLVDPDFDALREQWHPQFLYANPIAREAHDYCRECGAKLILTDGVPEKHHCEPPGSADFDEGNPLDDDDRPGTYDPEVPDERDIRAQWAADPISRHDPDCQCNRCVYGEDATLAHFHPSEY